MYRLPDTVHHTTCRKPQQSSIDWEEKRQSFSCLSCCAVLSTGTADVFSHRLPADVNAFQHELDVNNSSDSPCSSLRNYLWCTKLNTVALTVDWVVGWLRLQPHFHCVEWMTHKCNRYSTCTIKQAVRRFCVRSYKTPPCIGLHQCQHRRSNRTMLQDIQRRS